MISVKSYLFAVLIERHSGFLRIVSEVLQVTPNPRTFSEKKLDGAFNDDMGEQGH